MRKTQETFHRHFIKNKVQYYVKYGSRGINSTQITRTTHAQINRQINIYIYYLAVTEYFTLLTILRLSSRQQGSTAKIISNQYFLSLKPYLLIILLNYY